MIDTKVGALNASVEKSKAWLDELRKIGSFHDEAQAYTALHAVLHTLRDGLTVEEAAQLGAHMPTLIKGVYYDGWRPAKMPERHRSRQGFLGLVRDRLGNCNVGADEATRAVFALLERKIDPGEVEDVRNMTHHEIRDLWS